ncbi:alanine--glyoxylate aminotransferase family protein [Burkholderia cenocepacia]|nr:alanine--glyoxylate aminotransferase family protein [Burkholderia cenocepacia]HDR9880357.1 alanine--glyoxylate aminotransferase family protein [Burkholderia cenocepacia]HDR9887648.1 alanine--glyoxylate aminotransferase family protein [Burkholderia cenocepacia]
MATPGPTEVPHEILLAGAREVLHHRSPQMEELVGFTNERLKAWFRTTQPVYTMLSSGTGAMEASVCNPFSAGDKVLVVKNGYWGERFTSIATAYGLTVVPIEAPWGQGVDVGRIAEAAARHPDAAGILVTYSETSTGILNDVRSIGELFRGTETLVIVDAISALIAHPLDMDAWGLDIVTAASHKGFMMPPGLSFIAASERAWRRIERSASPRYYLSLLRYRDFYPLAPSSPAVSLLAALKCSIEMIDQEGAEEIIRRHADIATATGRALSALGFRNVLVSGSTPNHVITVAMPPAGVDADLLLAHLNSAYGVTITGGQGPFAKKVIRFGHVGALDFIDLIGLFGALERALADVSDWSNYGVSTSSILDTIRRQRSKSHD